MHWGAPDMDIYQLRMAHLPSNISGPQYSDQKPGGAINIRALAVAHTFPPPLLAVYGSRSQAAVE